MARPPSRSRGKSKSAKAERPAGPARRITIRALARFLNVSHPAVVKAVKSGRLSKSIGFENGVPFIRDLALAGREWAAGATKAHVSNAPSSAASPPGDGGPPDTEITLTRAQIQLSLQREESLKLANDEKRGRLIDAEVVRRESFDCARSIRDALLNLPDRLAGELAAEPDSAVVWRRLDEELRKALQAAADIVAAGESAADADDGAPEGEWDGE
jgi:phage terminase Nu1 subunit (DNA packaging protein)